MSPDLLAGLDPETRAKVEAKVAELAKTAKESEHPFLRAARDFATELRALDCKPLVVQCTIDGLCYSSKKLPMSIGVELAARLTALIGNGVMRALATGQGLDEVDIEEIAAAVVGVSERAMKDGLMPLVRDLLSKMQCGSRVPDGPIVGSLTPEVADAHFAGEYPHLIKVLVFSLAHNYRGPTLGVH